MSKTGQEFDKRLDETKYDLYEALKEVELVWAGLDTGQRFPHLQEVITKALAKVEKR